MKKRIVWLILSCLMVAALLLASCAPAAAPEEEKPAPPTEEKPAPPEEEKPAPPEEEEVVAPAPVGPRYGGVLNLVLTAPVIQMDQGSGQAHNSMPLNNFTFDTLTGIDWAKGPSGSDEVPLEHLSLVIPRFVKGFLAESWEIPDNETVIVHLRKGVRFHDKPPVNGREFVADDVVYTMMRTNWEVTKAYNYVSWGPERKPISLKAIDKYTVEIKHPPGMAGEQIRFLFDWTRIEPREIFDTYGDMEDWTRLIGTGPFIIEDFVPGSAATFVRNPNYWQKDPFHPENQLPYVDGVKLFIIQDASTREAALRTGKIDTLTVEWEAKGSLLRYTPELQYTKRDSGPSHITAIWMRTDTPPFDDIRVRRALSMAVDQRLILKEFYGGEGRMMSHPSAPFKGYMDLFTPIDELPESARELFEYKPEKAKQLLAEAGYPDGFKTNVLASFPEQVDLLSVVAAYLADIGVEMEIDVKEYGAYAGMAIGHTYTQMVMAWGIFVNPLRFHNYRTASLYNFARIDDERIMGFYNSVPQPATSAEWDELVVDLKPITSYILDQAWSIQIPQPYSYAMWQPWLKGYSGEQTKGFHAVGTWAVYPWIDQDMREAKTGKR